VGLGVAAADRRGLCWNRDRRFVLQRPGEGGSPRTIPGDRRPKALLNPSVWPRILRMRRMRKIRLHPRTSRSRCSVTWRSWCAPESLRGGATTDGHR